MLTARLVVRNAPAFTPDLHVESITGQTRLQYTPAMYDLGPYLYQVAYGYLISDALEFGNLESRDQVASIEVAGARIQTARDLLVESLRLDPADGYSWQYLAQAEAALGETAAARQALARSKELAPNTPSLALQRIYLLYGIAELSGVFEVPPLSSAEREIYVSDLAVLETLSPAFFRAVPQLP